MKKMISVWLCMCIMIYIASPIGFAVQAEEQFSIFADCSIQHTPAVMSAYSGMSVEDIVELAALTSHQYIDMVNNVQDQSNWSYVADICVDQATSYTTIVLYKILRARGFI